MPQTVSLKDLGGWPAKVVRTHKTEILKTLWTTVSMHALPMIQAAIDSYPRPRVSTGMTRRAWKVARDQDGVVVYNPKISASIDEHSRRPGSGISAEGREAIARWVHLHGMDKAGPLTSRQRATRRNLRDRGITKEGMRERSRWQRENRANAIAFLIARAIKRRGIPAQPVLAPIRAMLLRLVVDAVNRIVYGGTP